MHLLTFGQAVRAHRCFTVSGDAKCFVCGTFLCVVPPPERKAGPPAEPVQKADSR